MAHLPEGWTFKFRKSLSGRCFLKEYRVEAEAGHAQGPVHLAARCAHAHLPADGLRHVEEMEAEQWAHARMREAGVPVPRAMTNRAKRYVARKIEQATVRGAKTIDPKAVAYAKPRRR